MINVKELLFKICEDDRVYDSNFDMVESGVLDSFAFIELFAELEDRGIIIQPTRIDRNLLKTPASLEKLIEEYEKIS